MKYKLYIPEWGETIDDAHDMECKHGWEDSVVREFCDHLYHNRDGWEWMGSDGGHTKICVVDETGKTSYYVFEVEYEPQFLVWRQEHANQG